MVTDLYPVIHDSCMFLNNTLCFYDVFLGEGWADVLVVCLTIVHIRISFIGNLALTMPVSIRTGR